MKFFAFLLLISLINLSVTNGQETCRKWKEDKSTNWTLLFGDWFTYLENTFFVKGHDLCSEYSIYWNSTSKAMILLNTQHYDDNSTKYIKGTARKTPFPGTIDVVYENGLILGISALGMDENYGLFGGCFMGKGNFFNFEFGFLVNFLF